MSVALETRAPARKAPRRATGVVVVALLGWSVLALVGRFWLMDLQDSGRRMNFDDAAPLIGTFDWHPSPRLLFSIVVALVTVIAAPRLVSRLRWGPLLWLSAGWSALWSVVVAVADTDGWRGLTRPLLADTQYLSEVDNITSLEDFVASFVDRVPTYATHVSSHPPGMVIVHWSMDQVGLGGVGWAALASIAVAASGVAAVLLAVKELTGEGAARSVAPFLAVAPIAIWIATSADAFFAGVGAWAITGVVLATGRVGRRSDALAFGGGLAFGATAFLSYGLPVLALVPAVVAVARRRIRPLLVAAFGAALVFLAFALAGFWWFDGLDAAHAQFHDGVGGRRPMRVFWIVNWSILAVALGPVVTVALARLRDRASWLLVGGALAAVALATLSGYSKGEVERIFLPFAPWVLVACVALGRPVGRARLWLGVQAAYTIVLTTALRTPW